MDCTDVLITARGVITWRHGLWTLGREFTEDDKDVIRGELSKAFIKGVTFSGGDPLVWYKDVLELMKLIKEEFPTKDIWLYTRIYHG